MEHPSGDVCTGQEIRRPFGAEKNTFANHQYMDVRLIYGVRHKNDVAQELHRLREEKVKVS